MPGWPEIFHIEREVAGGHQRLRRKEFAQMTSSDDNRRKLVGFFGTSLRESEWDPVTHPSFAMFASGMLCYECTPYKLRSDPELLEEFPPRRLAGLCGGWMHWRSPKTIAEHKRVGFKPQSAVKPGAHLGLAWSAPRDQ